MKFSTLVIAASVSSAAAFLPQSTRPVSASSFGIAFTPTPVATSTTWTSLEAAKSKSKKKMRKRRANQAAGQEQTEAIAAPPTPVVDPNAVVRKQIIVKSPKTVVVEPKAEAPEEHKTAAVAEPVPEKVSAEGPTRPVKQKVVVPPTDPVRAEKTHRGLLARRVGTKTPVPEKVVAVGPTRPVKQKVVVPPTDPVRAEKTHRGLLATRLAMKPVPEKVVAAGPTRPVKQKVVVPPTDPVRAEKTSRGLLAARVEREAKARAIVKAEEDKVAAELAEMQGARQQPRPPAIEDKLASKYASIEDGGERAFQILVDLGMVEIHA